VLEITLGVIFCNAFLVHHLAERNEIWHDGEHWCIAGHLLFWLTLVHFSRSKFSAADISHTFCRSATKFGVVRVLAIGCMFPEFGELWSGIL